MTQKFKGDALELKMEAAASPAFDSCSAALDSFHDAAYVNSQFLLMLYDSGRMPFSDRVTREAFVGFFREALKNFPNTGTFEAYLFILRSIFGANTEVLFAVPDPGKIEILVDAEANLPFSFVAWSLVGGQYVYDQVVTSDNEPLQFRSLSGIESEAELKALLAEIIPGGIWPDITLGVFEISDFIAEESGGDFSTIVDHLGNKIVFFETGEG